MPFAQAAPWTVFQDCKVQTEVDVDGHAAFGYSSGSDEVKVVRNGSGFTASINDGTDNPSVTVLDSASGYSPGDRLKVAISSVDGSEITLAVNGSSASSSAGGGSVDTSGFATVGIGMLETGGPDVPITIRQAQLLSIAKTAGELETMTTI
jgi:hypothetical protein